MLLLDFKVEDKELLDYLVSTWKYRDLILHSVQMQEMEKQGVIWYNLYRHEKAIEICYNLTMW